MQCSTLITSPYSAMLKTRSAAIKLRNGSPKFKDAIRERCRERIRSRRTALFDNSRNLSNGQEELSCILRKELQDIYANLSDEDSGFSSQASMDESEPQSAEELWLMDEYDRMIALDDEFLQSMLDEKLICPLCQRAGLTANEQEKLAICQGCSARISAPEGLSDLEFKLNTAVDEHQQLCSNIPSFIQVGDGSNSVYMVKKNDGYPNFICKECYVELRTSYEFAIKVLQSEDTLQTYLEKLHIQLGQNTHDFSNEVECENTVINNTSTAANPEKALRSGNSYLAEDTSQAIVPETNESSTNFTSSTANKDNYLLGEYATTSSGVLSPNIKREIQEGVETDDEETDFEPEYNSKDPHDEIVVSTGSFKRDKQSNFLGGNRYEGYILPTDNAQTEFKADVSEIELEEEGLHDSSMREELRDSSLREAELRDSTMREEELRDSSMREEDELHDSSMREVELHDSSMREEDELHDSSLREEELHDSSMREEDELHDSSLREVELHDSSMRFEKYNCRACEERFVDDETLNKHKCMHIRKKLFKCRHCGKCFFLKKEMNHHICSRRNRKPTTKKQVSCSVCRKKFDSKFSLESHELIHSNSRPHKCEICESTFKRKHHLTDHLRLHFTDTEPETCLRCNETYYTKNHRCTNNDASMKTKRRLNKNSRDVSGNGELAWHRKCSVCGKIFDSRWRLVRHFRIHTGEKPYSCEECGRRFSERWKVKRHKCQKVNRSEEESLTAQAHSTKEQFRCNYCLKVLSNSANLRRHIRIHAGEKPYSCKKCKRSFSDQSHIKQHKCRTVYRCGQCTMVFFEKNALAEHELTHSIKERLRCDYCLKLLSNSSNLRRHIRIHTGEKPYSCEECGRRFSDRSQLKQHKCQKVEEEQFRCNYCQKLLSTKQNLERHIRIHTEEKPYSCKKCKRTFSDQSCLKRHKCRTVYRCGQCTMVFFKESALTEHELTHSIKEQLRCNYCQKLLSSKQTLERHIRIHTGEKPFDCSSCGKKFSDVGNCKKHNAKCLMTNYCAHCKQTFSQKERFDEHFCVPDQRVRCKYCYQYFDELSLLQHTRVCSTRFRNLVQLKIKKQNANRNLNSQRKAFNHGRLHFDVKRNQCEVCNNCYSTKHSLRVHMRIHTGEKPYRCTICEERFRLLKTFKRHKCANVLL